jgi:competence protein ComEC
VGKYTRVAKSLPFLKLVLSYFTGSILGKHFPIDAQILICVHVGLATLILVSSFINISTKWKLVPYISFTIIIYIITTAWINYHSNSFFRQKIVEIHGSTLLKIEEPRKESIDGARYIATIYEKDKSEFIKRGKTDLFIKTKILLEKGDVILTRQQPSIIKKNHNPGAFDYYSFSVMNGIFYSTTIFHEDMHLYMGRFRGTLDELVFQVRNNILSTIRKYIISGDRLGIAEAMLIGYKSDLTPSLNSTYSNAGVSHVIAISGMHLGLIYLIIHQIFAYFFRKRSLHMIAIMITLPLLWLFSMVTGSSASVVRSAIMYSFIIVGDAISKKSNPLNSLLGAGFMMNVICPNILNDLGFQLSFAAVLSIILFYQPIRNTVYTKNKLLQMGWNFVALSIAAQIITIPLVIFHFQKFSTYSLLNNIVIVPLSSTVLVLEIILCLCPVSIISSKILAPLINLIIGWMNAFASTMNKVPFSILGFPSLEWYELLIWSICLISLLIYLKYDHGYGALITTLVSIWFILFLNLSLRYELKKRHQIVLLNLKNEGSIIHQHGTEAKVYVYGNTNMSNKSFLESIKNALKKLGVEKSSFSKLPDQPLFIEQKKAGRAILINTSMLDIRLNKDLFKRNTYWILDGSTKLWKIREWRKQAQNLHLRFLHTAETGPIFIDCQDFHEFSRKN